MGNWRRNPIDRLGDTFGSLVIVLSVLIVVSSLAGYVFSEEFSSMITLRELLLGILGWLGISAFIWWLGTRIR